MKIPGVVTTIVNYSGHVFGDYYVSRDLVRGPGWFVYGRNSTKYGTLANGKGAYFMLCARPDIPLRKYRHYNVGVHRGWRTKQEAQAIADQMNRHPANPAWRDPDFPPE